MCAAAVLGAGALVITLAAFDTQLNPVAALLVAVGGATAFWVADAGLVRAKSTGFPAAQIGAGGELESAKDTRVRRIEDDLFRTIEAKRQGVRSGARALGEVASLVEAEAERRGMSLHLSSRTAGIIAYARSDAAARREPRFTRAILTAALKELDGELTRVLSTDRAPAAVGPDAHAPGTRTPDTGAPDVHSSPARPTAHARPTSHVTEESSP